MAVNLGLDDELRAIKALPRTDRTWATKINDLLRKAYHSTVNRFGPSSRRDSVAAGSGFPVGGIMDFGSTSVPTGFVVCDGRSLSRTTYSALFSAIGTTFGNDNATTFKVPDFSRRQAVGRTSSVALGVRAGAELVVMAKANLPEHTHAASGLTVGSVAAHGHQGIVGFGQSSGFSSNRESESFLNRAVSRACPRQLPVV